MALFCFLCSVIHLKSYAHSTWDAHSVYLEFYQTHILDVSAVEDYTVKYEIIGRCVDKFLKTQDAKSVNMLYSAIQALWTSILSTTVHTQTHDRAKFVAAFQCNMFYSIGILK